MHRTAAWDHRDGDTPPVHLPCGRQIRLDCLGGNAPFSSCGLSATFFSVRPYGKVSRARACPRAAARPCVGSASRRSVQRPRSTGGVEQASDVVASVSLVRHRKLLPALDKKAAAYLHGLRAAGKAPSGTKRCRKRCTVAMPNIQRRNDPLVRPGWAALGLVGLEQDLRSCSSCGHRPSPGRAFRSSSSRRRRQGHWRTSLLLASCSSPNRTNRPTSDQITADAALGAENRRRGPTAGAAGVL